MKVHVMVATTQGLVAIQTIYAQDPDIRSVVSINGTTNISPISTAYHHFVKKGVGIIEADFGASSYRINIAGPIDQGNSWQLGFYLAHAAHAQELLGNGQLKSGDMVICASGEINTSELSVLAVEQLPVKLERAANKIAEWDNDVTVHFILPKANQDAQPTTPENLKPQQLIYVESLQQALSYLPINSKTISNKKAITTVSTNNQVSKTSNLTQHRALLVLLVLGLAVALVLYFAGGWHKKNQQPADPAMAYDKIISATGIQTSNNNPIKTLLRLGYSQTKNCKNAKLSYQELGAKDHAFAEAKHANLCDIRLVSEQNYSAVLAINISSHRFVQATKQQNTFVIPVPSNSSSAGADYLLLAFLNPINSDMLKKIHAYLFNLSDDYRLSDSDLSQLPALAELDYQVFSHQLSE